MEDKDENTCAYDNCFNKRADLDPGVFVQSWLCSYHRTNDGITIDSVLNDHKHTSKNRLRKGIEYLIKEHGLKH